MRDITICSTKIDIKWFLSFNGFIASFASGLNIILQSGDTHVKLTDMVLRHRLHDTVILPWYKMGFTDSYESIYTGAVDGK